MKRPLKGAEGSVYTSFFSRADVIAEIYSLVRFEQIGPSILVRYSEVDSFFFRRVPCCMILAMLGESITGHLLAYNDALFSVVLFTEY